MLCLVLFWVFFPSAWCTGHNFWFPLPGNVDFIPSNSNQSLFLKAVSWSFSIKKREPNHHHITDIQEMVFIVTAFATITRGRGYHDALNHLMFQCLGDAAQYMKGGCDVWISPNWFANPSSQSWFRSVLTVFRFYVFDCYVYCSIQWKVNVFFVYKESCSILYSKWLLIYTFTQ